MPTAIIFHDTIGHIFVVDRYRSQVVKDVVKFLPETQVHYPGLDKTDATYFGTGKERVSIVRLIGKGGHFDRSLKVIIDILEKTNNVELEATSVTITDTFHEFIRRAYDLPRGVSIIPSQHPSGEDTPYTILTTTDGMVDEGKSTYMFRYDSCELHFEPQKMTISHPSVPSEVHNIDTESIDVANTIIPLCIRFMYNVQRIRHER